MLESAVFSMGLADVAPFVHWPAREGELEELEAWLLLSAAVWNTTVAGSERLHGDCDVQARIDDLHRHFGIDATAAADDIAARKRRLFPDDRRTVAAVKLVTGRGRAVVLATGISLM